MADMIMVGQGSNFAELGNAVSDAMYHALTGGMAADEAACCAIAVIADYARREYGDEYLKSLAEVVVARARTPIKANP